VFGDHGWQIVIGDMKFGSRHFRGLPTNNNEGHRVEHFRSSASVPDDSPVRY
jgi:hypothetical protein